jgi:hypothetical protein
MLETSSFPSLRRSRTRVVLANDPAVMVVAPNAVAEAMNVLRSVVMGTMLEHALKRDKSRGAHAVMSASHES